MVNGEPTPAASLIGGDGRQQASVVIQVLPGEQVTVAIPS
jgi:hypothetical protein